MMTWLKKAEVCYYCDGRGSHAPSDQVDDTPPEDCSACGGTGEIEDQPQDGDYFVSYRNEVFQNRKNLGKFDSEEEALEFVAEHMEEQQFWPNAWLADGGGSPILAEVPSYTDVLRRRVERQITDEDDALGEHLV